MASNRFRLHLRTVAITLAGAALLGAAGGALVLYSGWYNVAATQPHFSVVHWMFDTGLRASVQRHARDIQAPPLSSPQQLASGAMVYQKACAHCHGGPGVAPADWGKSMQPAPGPLVDAARRWKTRELYWLTRHGIRMSGMPAWEYHLSDAELWSVVAFLEKLPGLSAPAYRALTTAPAPAPVLPGATPVVDMRQVGDAARGKIALTQHACQTCHIVPGVIGAKVYIGRPLNDFADQKLIAGRLPNNRHNLERWLLAPQQIDPTTAMPDMGLSQRDARDIAAYLLSR